MHLQCLRVFTWLDSSLLFPAASCSAVQSYRSLLIHSPVKEIFPSFGHHEQSCYKYLCVSFCVDTYFQLIWINIKECSWWSYGKILTAFVRYYNPVFQNDCTVLHSLPINKSSSCSIASSAFGVVSVLGVKPFYHVPSGIMHLHVVHGRSLTSSSSFALLPNPHSWENVGSVSYHCKHLACPHSQPGSHLCYQLPLPLSWISYWHLSCFF